MNYKQILKAAFPALPAETRIFETSKPGARMKAFATLVKDDQTVRVLIVDGLPLEAVEHRRNGQVWQYSIREGGKNLAKAIRAVAQATTLDTAELDEAELEAATAPDA